MSNDNRIRALWLCNMMPSFVAKALGEKGSNKEGWIAGMASMVMEKNEIDLAVAFPTGSESIVRGYADGISYYGFYEDGNHPENYDASLEKALNDICEEYKPDVIHCFGTEYPHTYALLNNEKWNKKTLIHLQGLMEPYARSYCMGLPENVIKRSTFRDYLKKDAIWQQQEKYFKRANTENKLLKKAVNVCGRTDFDKKFISEINPDANYFKLNETLRIQFYSDKWDREKVKEHTIFVSQGNYPLKGIHYVIKALSIVKKKYADVKVFVAGDNVTRHSTIKEKIKISSYGKYLLDLITENDVSDNIEFIGQKTADEMKEIYLSSELFLIPSVLENSPNSLGEAMVLGVPCVSANIGGIPSMADDEKEVLMYELEDIDRMAEHIMNLFSDSDREKSLSENARNRAMETHSREKNYVDMIEIYKNIRGN